MNKYGILFTHVFAALLLDCVEASFESDGKNGFIFLCPRTLKTGSTNELLLRRFGNLESGVLKLNLTYKDASKELVTLEKSYNIEGGAVESFLELYVAPIDNSIYGGNITINGTYGDKRIEAMHFVDFTASKENVVIIQTEKSLYTEGENVKFRVLRVDKYLNPSADAEADIYVNDPNGNRLFQWNGMNFGQGIKEINFTLADEPIEGTWKISASFKGDITSTTIEVKQYVLPVFKVTIKAPSSVLHDIEEIPITICANYTYGKPVKGNLRVYSSLLEDIFSDPVNEYDGKIDGCFDYTIHASRFKKYISEYFKTVIEIRCEVEEFCTGVEKNEVQLIEMISTPILLKFDHLQGQFCKPGLPYNGKLVVKYPDNTLASDENIQICYTVLRKRVLSSWWASKKIQSCKNYTSDVEGTIGYIIPPWIDLVAINIEAISLKYKKKSIGWRGQISLTQLQTSMSLTPWYSPSGSFIQLQTVQETLFCNTRKSFKLLFTSKKSANFTFHYQVISHGNVVHSGFIDKSFSTEDDVSSKYNDAYKSINVKKVQLVPLIDLTQDTATEEEWPSAMKDRFISYMGEATIDLEITARWSPYFHLLVYYIRDDREMVADSQKFKVERCFRNQVKLNFGNAVKQPATEASIRVSASPNSLCSIKIMDKSISLLNTDDQLTKKVSSILENFDTGEYYKINHCYEDFSKLDLSIFSSRDGQSQFPKELIPSYEDSLAAFENSGYLIITDFVLFLRPCYRRDQGYEDFLKAYSPDDSEFDRGEVHSEEAMSSTAWRQRFRTAEVMPTADSKVGVEATKSVAEVRNYLPETWLFNLEITGDDGEFVTKKVLPHTITEWVGSAVCINAEDGLGISNRTSIQGFQAFFLSSNVPYSVVRGEQFWITISVFSYVDDALPIKLFLDELKGFRIVSESIESEICVQPRKSNNLKIKLEGTSLGQQNITVRAETAKDSGVCGSISVSAAIAKNTVLNSLTVEAEGWPVEVVESVLFCPKDKENGVFNRKFSIGVPEDVVPDSVKAFIDVTGNVFGKSLHNLEKLVTMPTGCGEQNMVKFVPNVVAMKVLRETNQLTDELKLRIKNNRIKSVQRQMKYIGYSASSRPFDKYNSESSMFLTSFVFRYFSEAAKDIGINYRTLDRMQNWIISYQQNNGCFPDVGKFIERGFGDTTKKGNGEGLITAYVTISLLISGYPNQTVIDSALSCIKKSEDKSFYATFLFSYAEVLADKADSAKYRIASARNKASRKAGGVEYYHDVNASKSQDLETAAYAVLAILKLGGSASDVLPIVRYLIQNMNSRGGFYSTQDTCVGLEALGEFAKLTFKDSANIVLKVSGGLDQDIEIKEDEKLLVKRHNIQNVHSELDVQAEGSGCAIIQNVVQYNIRTLSGEKSFHIKAVGDSYESGGYECKKFSISITVSYIPEGKKTGMALVEVKMISGMVPVMGSLKKLLEDEDLQLMQYEIEKNVIVFYFNEIRNSNKRFSFDVTEIVVVENAQPGTVTVYDYYNTEFSSKISYSLGNYK